MEKIRTFIKSTILGGVIVVLPIAILAFIINWIVNSATDLIQPVTDFLKDNLHLPEFVDVIIIVIAVIIILFLLGTFVRVRLGGMLLRYIEGKIFNKAPGYSTIREIIVQLLGTERKPFSSVALAQPFGSDTLVTAFITEEHADGSYTVFVPNVPNPMSGNIFHLKAKYVHHIDVPVEEVLRSFIGFGTGSKNIIVAYNSEKSLDKR